MKLSQVKVGMLVAVNDLPNGTVYSVEKIHDHVVSLYYKSGGTHWSGGMVDVSILQKPSKAQLEEALKIA